MTVTGQKIEAVFDDSQFYFRTGVVFLICLVCVYSFELHARDNEFEMLNLTAGQVGILDDLDGPQRYGLEYRFKSFLGPFGFKLIPAIGLAVANNNARFTYADLRHDFYLNNNWLLIPSFGAGIFKDSAEIELGNNVEFRSGLEIAYEFHNRYRAGLAIFHLSNGGVSSTNPGTEALVFSICIPMKY